MSQSHRSSRSASPPLPVLIIGAGLSGLLLAQHLRVSSVPFRIFDRDRDFTTRGVGWGLTLHWSLPALRALLPADLLARLPSTYVDRAAVEAGQASTFPLHDLAMGDLKAATPRASEAQRVRVTREGLRRLLAEGVDLEWGKAFQRLQEEEEEEEEEEDAADDDDEGENGRRRRRVRVFFDDGSHAYGSLVVACDGGGSRVRRALLPDRHQGYRLPIRVLGFRAQYTPEEIAPMKALDPFFLQATSSQNDTFMYFSVLDAPGNHHTDANPDTRAEEDSSDDANKHYTCQVVVSWPYRPGFWNNDAPTDFAPTPEGNVDLIRAFAETWAEPFRSVALGGLSSASALDDLKCLELSDYVPPKDLRTTGRVVLMGDALHAMTMYRGEGANHAIADVLDFSEIVTPHLKLNRGGSNGTALDAYTAAVIKRTRPAVLAARRACLDAHDWPRIIPSSPLLTKREMFMNYDEEEESFSSWW
ncbi:FAD/NAD(P)-binding domain-containing protein [Sodiomyces alkalinus F11]|uniref:FAD/NAD(P)-binding domain-containing protein n=1 Tax=Sodiomyces alkalinus (strain CBS 110278 / VKM F-3762 / F11) TaxID=1314773 RepID=A0A3N2Q3M6_SODAK|nr:FAD/NAD(P)-binding domain-containing protein [Sodiomyces alkalinus F11]ROT41316.1 FAD/NAD(P)-binding domain-containing protein [Sodiomyces alkalinus F11]